MLTIKERHQIERDSRAPFIFEALKREGLVDQSNMRTKSLKDIYHYIKSNDVKIGGDNFPIIFVSRSDVEYTFKKYGIKGRKSGRKTTQVKEDMIKEESKPENTIQVDTDSCIVESEVADSNKSVSTPVIVGNRRIIRRNTFTNAENTDNTLRTSTHWVSRRVIKRTDPIPEEFRLRALERRNLLAG